ncbi:tripartite tricarboxylate transporter TctB family protein [Oceanobacillus sp. FSL W7-1304]|uniref:tripartite tricarboxylate transporter TctB family protein n=1 Tax=Oceanobacillus sp. FSL W7-1304 TaxID=2975322 RepID=UPI0030DB77BD
MVRQLHQDIYIGFVLILIGLFLFVETLDFTQDSATYPRGIIILFIFFSILIIIEGFRKTKLMKEKNVELFEGEESPLHLSVLKSPLLSIAFVTIYAILIPALGFFVSTFLFSFVFLWFMGVKKWKTYVLTAVGIDLFIYLLFVMQLNVRLPQGILF